jgi:hypothetical protein
VLLFDEDTKVSACGREVKAVLDRRDFGEKEKVVIRVTLSTWITEEKREYMLARP